MSTNTFLKLGDIEGESTISGFEKQIELVNFNNQFHQPTAPIRSSTGPTTGQAVHSMMNFTKYLDSSSPNICKALWSAKILDSVVITCCRMDNDTPIKFLEIAMENVVVAGYDLQGGGDLPYEVISLNYATIKYTYIRQKEEGGPDGNIAASHDLKTNKVS
ncbi:MAG: type VI secretion system tube protein Hcp [Bilophila sp.]